MDVKEKARKAYTASIILANVKTEVKNQALNKIAQAIEEGKEAILKENEGDVKEGLILLEDGKLSKALLDRLKLSDSKISGIVESVKSVSNLNDPVGEVLSKTELSEALILSKRSVPIGVVGTVFESRPDVVPQIASLALKSGNSVIMKGGSEALNTNRKLYELIRDASESVSGIPSGWIQLIETRGDVSDLLKLDEYVDLVIPRGSNSFVQYVMDNTRIPVLGHADGICHVYVDKEADLSMAYEICFDSKTQYPAVCNALETMLVDEKIAEQFLPEMCEKFKLAGVELRGCARTREIVSDVVEASDEDWVTEYNDLILSIKVVEGLDEAIEHINTFGSHHTDVIVTEDQDSAKKFLDFVDSACVFYNCSTRFSDGFRFGLGAEVGISTNKIHARGPVGLEGLVIYKWVLEGKGQIVADFAEGKSKFTHKRIG